MQNKFVLIVVFGVIAAALWWAAFVNDYRVDNTLFEEAPEAKKIVQPVVVTPKVEKPLANVLDKEMQPILGETAPTVSDDVTESLADIEEAPPAIEMDIENPSLEKRFEAALNEMLEEVYKVMGDYKDERQIMVEITKTENLRDPQYISDNAEVLKEVSENLRATSSDVLNVFEKADSEVQMLLSDMEEDVAEVFAEKWETLKIENIGAYQAFFAQEDEAIKAHDRLMRFYFTRQDSYKYDPETKEIVFESPSDQLLARKLRVQVNRLSRSQDIVLRGN